MRSQHAGDPVGRREAATAPESPTPRQWRRARWSHDSCSYRSTCRMLLLRSARPCPV